VPQPSAPPQPAEPLTILYATESGNSEKLAGDVAKAARQDGLKPSLVDMADLEVASLAGVKRLVVIAATWARRPPGRATRACKELMSDAAAPRSTQFGVLALATPISILRIGKALDEASRGARGKACCRSGRLRSRFRRARRELDRWRAEGACAPGPTRKRK